MSNSSNDFTQVNADTTKLSEPDAIIVGAGTAGASMAIALARQGRKIVLIEKNLIPQDRIVGELLQPGGIRALEQLNLAECAQIGCDSIIVNGYTVIMPSGVSKSYPKGSEVVLKYPNKDPENIFELFGKNFKDIENEKSSAPRGRSFHNGKFVERLRQAAKLEPNIEIIEGTVVSLLEDKIIGKVEGVSYKESANNSLSNSNGSTRKKIDLNAPLTIIADGIWSGLRKCTNKNKPFLISNFVGVIVEHLSMEAPVPYRNFGHVVLSQPSPILIYQISPTETRVLVDVAGKMPNSSNGELREFLERQSNFLPEVFRGPFLEAVKKGEVKSMPNRALKSSAEIKQGVVLIGDALNMRHPLTGGGMTVALKDVVLLSELLSDKDFNDLKEMNIAVATFHRKRVPHSATINVLANALYYVFSLPTKCLETTDTSDEAIKARENLQDSCFEYLSIGGVFSAGPIGLLSGLTPSPSILAIHFFMVALYGVRTHLFPFGFFRPSNYIKIYRILLVACGIIMPLLEMEKSTVLSWFLMRKLIQLIFPWEHLRWSA